MTSWGTLAALLAVLGSAPAHAQSLPHDADTPPPACCRIPAGTVIELELVEPISSRNRTRGEKFALRLHGPLSMDGVIVLPAGTPGVGEIVHADRARGGGKPGELILAARYLQAPTIQLPLRGLTLDATGKDNSRTALAVAVAIGPFAQFIHGGEIEIPAGTIARAKLQQDFTPTGVASILAAQDVALRTPSTSIASPGNADRSEPVVSTVTPQQE
jgi:hypothetical protein